MMIKTIGIVILSMSIASAVFAAEDVVSAVHGTVKKIDPAAKKIVITTADGTDHSLKFVDSTAVHGAKVSAEAGKDTWHGLTVGTEVVAHYSKSGGEDTAVEVDKVGRDGLKASKGTVEEFDRNGKKLVVKTDDGVESTFRLSDDATQDAGKDIAKGTEKGSRVTVYYTEDTGKKIAHFFEKG